MLEADPDPESGTQQTLLELFARMPLEDRQRITSLEVVCWGHEDPGRLSEGVLRSLLQRLPSLTALDLACLPPFDNSPLSTPALGGLHHMRSLTVGGLDWVIYDRGLLGERLKGQLTRLEVAACEGPLYDHLTPPQSDCARHGINLPEQLCQLRSLRELELSSGHRCTFAPDDVRLILAALPPRLETLSMEPVVPCEGSGFSVTCRLDGRGRLTSFELSEAEEVADEVTYSCLSSFLAETLVGPALGPRLPLLNIDLGVGLCKPPRQPDPARELLARCDAVFLLSLDVRPGLPPGWFQERGIPNSDEEEGGEGGEPGLSWGQDASQVTQAVMAVAEMFGVPGMLTLGHVGGALLLRPSRPAQPGQQQLLSPPPPPAAAVPLPELRRRVELLHATVPCNGSGAAPSLYDVLRDLWFDAEQAAAGAGGPGRGRSARSQQEGDPFRCVGALARLRWLLETAEGARGWQDTSGPP
ncbi:hypothetical protein HYH03_015349 [Edaphochlamys debaryana]|uniref:Uncharacterized protein n=1 Tax=Edaphochlamys debaryana TaxID=47281 RepID=A0A836BR79_9CHLO|nr:hypothetical protein HYH03_015349 [Edaphochlamys debaryana]|eukprot:KAG2485905.1 hypothetical protein HYH03_015349 [Edaphochlamys debaryana]